MKLVLGILIGFIAGIVVAFIICGTSPEEVALEETTSTESGTTTEVENDETTSQEPVATISNEIAVEGPITVDTQTLSQGQRDLLQTFGIDADSIEITAEMMACAEAEVGKERLNEIMNGATPGFFEGLALAGCYNQ